MHRMLEAIRGQGSAAPDFDQAWAVERVLEAARRSAQHRRWARLEEVA